MKKDTLIQIKMLLNILKGDMEECEVKDKINLCISEIEKELRK